MSNNRRRTQTLHNVILPEHYEQMLADMGDLAVSMTEVDAALGAYYTPAAIVALVDPVALASGSGSYLVDIIGNPPYAR